MAESPPVPPASTFVVRFWREWSAAGSRWRGRIEHVQSGESAAFLDMDGMLEFVRRVGVIQGDESRLAREEEWTRGSTEGRCNIREEATTR